MVVPGLLATTHASGCSRASEGPKRYPINGTVTYAGKAVPIGRIAFEPDTAAGNDGPGAYGEIKDGRYQTGLRFGTVGGPHIVRIDGFTAFDANAPDGGVKPLFQAYATKIDLPREKSTQNFDVPKNPSPRRRKDRGGKSE